MFLLVITSDSFPSCGDALLAIVNLLPCIFKPVVEEKAAVAAPIWNTDGTRH